MKERFNPGFLSGITLIIDGDYLKYVSALSLSEQGSVPIKSIKAITVEAGKKGYSAVNFLGEGTSLGSFSTAIKYAEKCQRWLVEKLNL